MSAEWLSAHWPAPPNVIAGTTLRGSEFQLPTEPQWLKQVHGTRVVRAGSSAFDDGAPEADAVIANSAAELCAVKTADCLPVLLCSSDGSEIAAVHAGWRGLASGIIASTVATMSSPASDLYAWFGPAISQAAFEVGTEVREAFVDKCSVAARCFVPNQRGRWQADLYGLARQQLLASGVGDVYGGGLCTFADKDRFFSYRRDGVTGRMVSFIYRAQ